MLWLPPENPSEISDSEKRIRRYLGSAYRFTIAVFAVWQLFDFLFSAIWMHGYIWCLNLPIEGDLAEKSAGLIVMHQLSKVGFYERVLHAIGKVVFTAVLLFCSGYYTEKKSVWHLWRLSVAVGCTTGMVRGLQMHQRLFSALHEGFYAHVAVFMIGIILTIQKKEPKVPKDEVAEAMTKFIDLDIKQPVRRKLTRDVSTDMDADRFPDYIPEYTETSEAQTESENMGTDNIAHEIFGAMTEDFNNNSFAEDVSVGGSTEMGDNSEKDEKHKKTN